MSRTQQHRNLPFSATRDLSSRKRRSKKGRTGVVEALEDRTLLAIVAWDGGGGDLDWNNPLNWSGDAVPTAADDVFINVAGEVEVTHAAGGTVIKSLTSEESLSISGGSLTVNDPSVVNGSFTLGTGTGLTATGVGASFVANGTTIADRANITATNGAVISLPGLANYSGGSDLSAGLTATGSGSRIDFTGLTTLAGSTRRGAIGVQALAGGTVNMPALTNITGGTTLVGAVGAGSVIDLSALDTWVDNTNLVASSLGFSNGGTVQVGALRKLVSVNVTATAGQVFVLPQLQEYDGIGVGVGDNSSSLIATGAGSQLRLPLLTTLRGATRRGAVSVQALDGGLVDMSAVTNITGGSTLVGADGAGSVIDLSALDTWVDNTNLIASSLGFSNGGTVQVGALRKLVSVNVTATAGQVFVLPQLQEYDGIGAGVGDNSSSLIATGAGSQLRLPLMTTLRGATRRGAVSVQALGGGLVDMSAVTNITGGSTLVGADGAGSVIDLSALDTWVDDTNLIASSLGFSNGGTVQIGALRRLVSVNVTATAGQLFVLPQLQEYDGTGAGTRDNSSSLIANGAGSRLELPALTTLRGASFRGLVVVSAVAGGVIDAPLLANITGGSTLVSADGANSVVSLPALDTWLDTESRVSSALQFSNGGTVQTNNLRVLSAVSVVATGGQVISLPELESYDGSPGIRDNSATLAAIGIGSRLELPKLTTLTGAVRFGRIDVQALDGGVVEMTALQSVPSLNIQITSQGSGSELKLSANTTNIASGGLLVSNGGTVSGGTLDLTGGSTLSGNGTAQLDVLNSASIFPGSTVGTLGVTGGYSQTATGVLNIDINGLAAGSDHDQLDVVGVVTLVGTLSLSGGYQPQGGESFVIINNVSASPVDGTFAGLAEGATISNFLGSGFNAQISYLGGNGNDVVLTVESANDPPVIAADLAAVTANEGGTALNAGTFSDSQGNATVTVTASIGDVTQSNANGTWSWSLDVADGPTDPVTVTITATDDESVATTTTFTYSVNNVPPTISLSGSAVTNEGAPYTLNLGVVTDPGEETISGYKIIWGDGVIDTFSGSPANTTAVHVYADGPASQTHTVTVTDEDGTFLAGSLDVQVLNVAPTLVLSGTAQVGEGGTETYSFTVTDPGDDTFTLVSQSCGSNGVISNLTFNGITGQGSFDCSYPDGPAESNVTVHVEDSDGAAGNAGLIVVSVLNLPPTIPVDNDGAPNQVLENAESGTSVGITAFSSDPGLQDTVSFSLIDDAEGRFAINPNTGEVTVADGSLLNYEAATSHGIVVEASDNQGGLSTETFAIDLLNVTATISGTVFVDADSDGLFDGGTESAIDGVIIELLDGAGGFLASDVTEFGGVYAFEVDDEFGSYRIRETQPTGVEDGFAILGSSGGNVLSSNEMLLNLAAVDALDYDFAEVGLPVQAGDTASIGFWQNKNGQALIEQGGIALVNWLNTNFGNIFGSTFSDGDGDDAAEVASFYRNEFFKKKLKGTSKVDAQFMATALAAFFTSSNLSGGAVASNYGFNVTDTGIGTKVVNVGVNGAAFGVADNTDMTIMALLLKTNEFTGVDSDSDDDEDYSHVYDTNGDGVLDDAEKALRAKANAVYTSINESG